MTIKKLCDYNSFSQLGLFWSNVKYNSLFNVNKLLNSNILHLPFECFSKNSNLINVQGVG